MARKTRKPDLVLDDAQTGKLKSLAGSRTASARDVERARILLAYADGQSLSVIARTVGVSPTERPRIGDGVVDPFGVGSSCVPGSGGRGFSAPLPRR